MTYNDLLLPGLIGSNPLGAMAAFGLLRVCSEIQTLAGACLHWTWEQDWRAVLRTPESISRDELIEHLVQHQKERSMDAFNWSDDIKIAPKDYRVQMLNHVTNATLHNRLNADYFAAYGSEIITDRSKGNVKPTAWHMTAGRQKFLKLISKDLSKSMWSDEQKKAPRDLEKMLKSEAKKTAAAYNEALFGPWMCEDNVNSLGWDPSAKRLHALRHIAPTKDVFHCVRAAVWLAVEALPLYPTAAVSGKLQTTGFMATKPMAFVWPIWKPPIGLDTLRTLIMTSDNRASLLKRGVTAIYRSERAESNQGAAFLRPSAE
ncbi:MAG: hypothetical protein WAW52_05450 [Methanothrix sp.]